MMGCFPHRRGVIILGYNRSVMSHNRDTELAYVQGHGKGRVGERHRKGTEAGGWMQDCSVKPILDDGARLEKATLCDLEACD